MSQANQKTRGKRTRRRIKQTSGIRKELAYWEEHKPYHKAREKKKTMMHDVLNPYDGTWRKISRSWKDQSKKKRQWS